MKLKTLSPALRRRLFIGGGALALCLALGVTLWPTKGAAEPAVRREYPVTRETITVGTDATGSIGSETENAYSPAAVRLERYTVQVGDRVAVGDVLARFDKADVQRALDEAKQARSAKQLELDRLNAQIAAGQTALEQKIKEMQAAGGKSRDAELAGVRQARKQAQEALDAAKKQVGELEAQITSVQAEKDGRPQKLAGYEADLAGWAARQSELQTTLDGLLADVGADHADEIERLRLQISELAVSISDTTRQRDALLAADHDAKLAALAAGLESARSAVGQNEAALAAAQKAVENAKEGQKPQLEQENAQIELLRGQETANQKSLRTQLALVQTEWSAADEKASLLAGLPADPTLKAGHNGVVTALKGEPGGMTDPNVPLLQLGKEESRVLRLQVEPMDIVEVEVGQQVSFYVDAYPDVTFSGTVRAVAQLQNSNGKFDVQVSFEPTEERLLDGMGANATLIVKQKKDVLALSNKAIQFEAGTSYVWLVAADGSLEKREIKTGFSNGRVTEVLSGLTEQDVAVVEEHYEDA